jgi:hypothetical protein
LPPPPPLPKARKFDLRKPKRAAAQKATRHKVAEPSAYTVFISHSSKELWIAGQIAKEVELLGAKSWLDKKDLHGKRITLILNNIAPDSLAPMQGVKY